MTDTLPTRYSTLRPNPISFEAKITTRVYPTLSGSFSTYNGAEVHVVAQDVLNTPDQSWFWAPEWQAGEIEADRQAQAGEGVRYDSMDDFLNDLP